MAKYRVTICRSARKELEQLLGQINFFLEFDVCFFRSQKTFEIHPKKENR